MPQDAQQLVMPMDIALDTSTATVFSGQRTVQAPHVKLPETVKSNVRLRMDGLEFLSLLPAASIPVAFLDPQYRGVLDKLQYGNEGDQRSKRRCSLRQMTESTIAQFIVGIDRTLIPSGHLFLWLDKFHLCQGFRSWCNDTALDVVDLLTWDKGRFGMGYRTRRTAEYCVVLQKQPRKAKGVWKIHNITDVYREKAPQDDHPHAKPVGLQGELIAAVSNEGDYVIDPAAGSFSVMQAAMNRRRRFLGCDVNG